MTALRVIDVDEMQPDPDVQLAFSYSLPRAREIAATWKDDACGVLAVAPLDDGTYGIIDGRHRHAGALLRGAPQELRCDVFASGLTAAEKAEIKMDRDRHRRTVRQIEHFLLRITAEDPAACDIELTALEAGWTIGKGTAKNYDKLECVTALESLYRRDLLTRVMRLSTIWLGEPKANTGSWIGGLGGFCALGYDERLEAKHIERIEKMIPAKVVKIAAGEVQSYSTGSTRHGAGTAMSLIIADKIRATARIRKPRVTEGSNDNG